MRLEQNIQQASLQQQHRMISSSSIIVLMSLLALSMERPMAGYNYAVPDNPLVLPKRPARKTTTSKPPEKETTTELEEGTYQYPVPENPLQISKDLPMCRSDNGIDIRTTDPLLAEGKSPDVPGVNCKPSEKEDEVDLTTTTTTTTEATAAAAYQYPVPGNPLQLPKQSLIDDENFQINFEELPDFNPEAFPDLVEAERSVLSGLREEEVEELAPAPLTTPKSTLVNINDVVFEQQAPADAVLVKDELAATITDAEPEEQLQPTTKTLPILGRDFSFISDAAIFSRIIPRK